MSPEYTTDIELMERIQQFDSKSLELLYDRYSPILFSLIKRIVKNNDMTEEVLSDVFVLIWKKIDWFDFTTKDAYAWIILLARNKAVDYIRRKRDPESLPQYTDDFENDFIIPKLSIFIDPLDLKTTQEIKDSVEKSFLRLTEAQQLVINLSFYDGLTQAQIAKKLKIPLPTVENKIGLALKSFKESLIKGDV